jgi:hypothetical protein
MCVGGGGRTRQGIFKNETPGETLCIVSVPSTTLRIPSEAFIMCRGRTSGVLRAWKIRVVALQVPLQCTS